MASSKDYLQFVLEQLSELTKIIDIIRVSARLMHMAQCGGAVNRIAIVAMRS